MNTYKIKYKATSMNSFPGIWGTEYILNETDHFRLVEAESAAAAIREIEDRAEDFLGSALTFTVTDIAKIE